MAKPVKDKWLGARVDADMDNRVKLFTEATQMDMGELVRKAVDEYIINHPVKKPTKSAVDRLKPGEDK